MDFAGTLTLLGTILGIVAAFGAILDLVFLRQVENLKQTRNLRISIAATVVLLLVTLAIQYVAVPSSSVLTLIPGVPFPGSTLKACHVTVSDLPGAGIQKVTPPTYTNTEHPLAISGSSALYDLFQQLGVRFDAANPGVYHTTVAKLDSAQGLRDVAAGRSQIGLSDFYVQDDPDASAANFPTMLDYQVAVSPFALIVSRDLHDTVQNLTTQQILGIFDGTITNWREIGGPDEAITVFNRKIGSGTRVNFEKYVLGTSIAKDDFRAPTTGALVNQIAHSNGAIGYAATPSIVDPSKYPGQIFPVCIDGYGPTLQNINNGTYTFWAYEHAYVVQPTIKNPLDASTAAFLAYTCDTLFQKGNEVDTLNAGFLSPAIIATHPEASITHQGDYPQPQKCD